MNGLSLLIVLALMVIPLLVGRYAESGLKCLGALSLLPLGILLFGVAAYFGDEEQPGEWVGPELWLWAGVLGGICLEFIGLIGLVAGRIWRTIARYRELKSLSWDSPVPLPVPDIGPPAPTPPSAEVPW